MLVQTIAVPGDLMKQNISGPSSPALLSLHHAKVSRRNGIIAIGYTRDVGGRRVAVVTVVKSRTCGSECDQVAKRAGLVCRAAAVVGFGQEERGLEDGWKRD